MVYFSTTLNPVRNAIEDVFRILIQNPSESKKTINSTLIIEGADIRTYGDLERGWIGSPSLLFNPSTVIIKNSFQRDVGSDGFNFRAIDDQNDIHGQSIDIAKQAKKKSYHTLKRFIEKLEKVNNHRTNQTNTERTKFKDKGDIYRVLTEDSDKYTNNKYNKKDGKTLIQNGQLTHNEVHLLVNILDIEGVSFLPKNTNLNNGQEHFAFISAQNVKDQINKKKRIY